MTNLKTQPPSLLANSEAASAPRRNRKPREEMGYLAGVQRNCDRPEYRVWRAMKRRCNAPTCKCYPRYGGRGIRVCSQWNKFTQFFADMGPRPSPQHTLDRLDNSGNYEPSNCEWRTQREQQQNRRDNRKLVFRGETLCVSEIARRSGLQVSPSRNLLGNLILSSKLYAIALRVAIQEKL